MHSLSVAPGHPPLDWKLESLGSFHIHSKNTVSATHITVLRQGTAVTTAPALSQWRPKRHSLEGETTFPSPAEPQIPATTALLPCSITLIFSLDRFVSSQREIYPFTRSHIILCVCVCVCATSGALSCPALG